MGLGRKGRHSNLPPEQPVQVHRYKNKIVNTLIFFSAANQRGPYVFLIRSFGLIGAHSVRIYWVDPKTTISRFPNSTDQ